MSRWPLVQLREILERHDDWIDLDPQTSYRRITVRLWGKGLVLRGVAKGAEISARSQNRVRSGQFLVSKIDARHGAFGLVPKELDGAVVSSDFPAFDINCERALPGFLEWVTKTDEFVALCRRASEGSTNRVRLKEERFLAQKVLLPTLPEQRRIVARLDGVANRIMNACAQIEAIGNDVTTACQQLVRNAPMRGGTLLPASSVMRRRPIDVVVEPEQTYEFAGVYSFGRGVFQSGRKTGSEFSYRQLSRLRAGDFVYPKLMAWEGALGVVPPDCDGLVVSPEFPVFEIDRDALLPEVADIHFRDLRTWPELIRDSTGTNLRRKRLNPDQFLALPIPIPTREDQFLIRNLAARAAQIRMLEAETYCELDALLPSMLEQAFR